MKITLLLVVTAGAHLPVFKAGFIWDDDWLITNNPRLKTPDGLSKIWFSLESPDYFPITWTSLWVEWRLWGDNPAGYHTVSLIHHIIAAGLLWLVLARLGIPGAWLAAMVFAVHPVNASTVAWAAARKNTLSMLFFLLTVLAFIRYDSSRKWRWYLACLLLFGASLLSKTSVVMTPLALGGLLWWRHGRINWKDGLKLLPMLAIAFALAMLTVWTQRHNVIKEDVIYGPGENFFWKLAGAGMAPWFYVYKLLWPAKVAMIYPRWNINPLAIQYYLPGLGVVGVFASLWLVRQRSWARHMLFGLGFFIVMLFPVLGFFKMYYMRYSLVADHWLYIPMIGLLALIVTGVCRLVAKMSGQLRLSAGVLAGLIISILSILTFNQTGEYESKERFWRDNIAKYPSAWMAHFNLANTLHPPGSPLNAQTEQAVRIFREALRLKPNFEIAWVNLGNAYIAQDRLDQALEAFNNALAVNPRSILALSNRGAVLYHKGRIGEAVEFVKLALSIDPTHTTARSNLIEMLIACGDLSQALEVIEEGKKILKRDDPGFCNATAEIYIKQGKLEPALEQLQQVLALDPNNSRAMYYQGVTLGKLGRHDEARDVYLKALQHNPYPSANELTVLLGKTYLRLERPRDALNSFRSARTSPQAVKALAWVLASHADSSVRDGAESLRLADQLVQQGNSQDAEALDILAAALAETGRFDQAAQRARQAMGIMQAGGLTAQAERVRRRIDLYVQNQAYRSPTGEP